MSLSVEESGKRKRYWPFPAALFLISAVSYLDYITVPDLSSFLFYIPAIAMVVWYCDKWQGYVITIFSCLAWLTGKGFWKINMDYVFIWNAVIRFVTFWLSAYGLRRLRINTERLEELKRQLEMNLQTEKAKSRIDALTGAYNLRALHEMLSHERARCERYDSHFSLIYMDLDKFKELNDTCGHQFGDEMLQKMTQVIQKSIRKLDALARLDGDEFVILLPETDEKGAATVAKNILTKLSNLVPPLSTSIGIASFKKECPGDNEKCIMMADEAMYQAKKQGPGRIVHAPEL